MDVCIFFFFGEEGCLCFFVCVVCCWFFLFYCFVLFVCLFIYLFIYSFIYWKIHHIDNASENTTPVIDFSVRSISFNLFMYIYEEILSATVIVIEKGKRRSKFKSQTGLFAFRKGLMKKSWIDLFFRQLWVQIGQTELFSLGKATNQGEGKIWIQTRRSLRISFPTRCWRFG